jgi:hypothetical protein
LDWTKDPEESFEQLMDEEIRNIQNKYDTIILMWSGGTDSQTIYNVLKRNNVRIDEIIVFHDDKFEPLSYPKFAAKWLEENHTDTNTKITYKDRFDPVAKSRVITDENWIFENRVMIPRFALGLYDNVMLDYIKDNYANKKYCIINGHEQPDVIRTNTGFYSRHNSISYKSLMGFENVECFFTLPKLALKQSHMIKKFLIENKLETEGKPFRFQSSENYTRWAKSIGRHDEVRPGASFTQKDYEITFDKYILTPDNIDGALTAGVDAHYRILHEKDSELMRNFKKGIQNVLAQKDFCEHLMNGSPVKTNSVIGKLAGERIYSRNFFLGN